MSFHTPNASDLFSAQSTDQPTLLRAVIESLMDGVLVVSAQGEIVQSNHRGRQICKRLRGLTNEVESVPHPTSAKGHTAAAIAHKRSQDHGKVSSLADWKVLPPALWIVCQTLLDSLQEWPGLLLVPEHHITLSPSATEDGLRLRIRAQWLTFSNGLNPTEMEACQPSQSMDTVEERSYILVTLEDREQAIQQSVTADQKRYHFTPRETEIWRLRLHGQSYRDIAQQLFISQNTVKKHLKNILAKRRGEFEDVG